MEKATTFIGVAFSFEEIPIHKISSPIGTQKKKKWGYFHQKRTSNLTKNHHFLGTNFPLIPISGHLFPYTATY